MRRISCDLCGKDLLPGADRRYLVRMDARVVCEADELTADDLDSQDDPDHIEAMNALLAADDEPDVADDRCTEGRRQDQDDTPRPREFDLCGGCFRRFHADPLGPARHRKLQYSPN